MRKTTRGTARPPARVAGEPYVPGVASGRIESDPERVQASTILVITPGQIATLTGLPAGLVIVDAAPFSHTLIGLLGHGIPTVLVSQDQACVLEDGMTIAIDGTTGEIDLTGTSSPPGSEIPAAAPEDTRTADGTALQFMASVRDPSGAR